MSKQKTIKVRQTKLKQAMLEQLRRTPILEVACEKVGINRTTLYRWMKKSSSFSKEVEVATTEGRILVSEIAESQILSLIKNQKMDAIRFWLINNSPRYTDKLHIVSKDTKEEIMTPKQQAIYKRAIELGSFDHKNKYEKDNNS